MVALEAEIVECWRSSSIESTGLSRSVSLIRLRPDRVITGQSGAASGLFSDPESRRITSFEQYSNAVHVVANDVA
jgi:hypothetical protein